MKKVDFAGNKEFFCFCISGLLSKYRRIIVVILPPQYSVYYWSTGRESIPGRNLNIPNSKIYRLIEPSGFINSLEILTDSLEKVRGGWRREEEGRGGEGREGYGIVGKRRVQEIRGRQRRVQQVRGGYRRVEEGRGRQRRVQQVRGGYRRVEKYIS